MAQNGKQEEEEREHIGNNAEEDEGFNSAPHTPTFSIEYSQDRSSYEQLEKRASSLLQNPPLFPTAATNEEDDVLLGMKEYC